MNTFKVVALLAVSVIAVPLHAQDGTAITPYRPSVSSPAQLPTPGQLEFETGGLIGKLGDSRRESLPYTFKLAFNEQWGVLIGGEAYVSTRSEGGARQRGLGDTSLVLKRAFLLDSATALGLELGVKLPSAQDTIGSGKSDLNINSIFSQDIGVVHMDANLNATRLGAYEAGTGRIQTGWSASFSVPVLEKWGMTTEVSGTRRSGQANTAQLLVAAAYSPTKRLTIDFGVAKGLNPASQDWSLFSGVVLPLAKLW
ncbi:transporter [Duganella sp. BJB488]|uniref:transporter n=1 Tax=unclassified Duganella TaxID=2636909 RepID=UPI000E34F84D|nr:MULTISPECIES: transporter [unclassified Duganella]RFP09237.1 transporter [Duganella sp. BJB475]RFP13121.1 transporter [Duganella sp. BJB489]RFP17115.1 transporter [Duganella sp. BJB488]RFP25463.1 transporter [Duganella sp. BJB476]RFP31666.1 transporter [Duganella sp. BJB480]